MMCSQPYTTEEEVSLLSCSSQSEIEDGDDPGASMTPIAVFYDEAMIADSGSYSPAASKPRNVVHACLQQHLSMRSKGSPL